MNRRAFLASVPVAVVAARMMPSAAFEAETALVPFQHPTKHGYVLVREVIYGGKRYAFTKNQMLSVEDVAGDWACIPNVMLVDERKP